MSRSAKLWKGLIRSSGVLAVAVALPAAMLSTVQCSMVRKDVDRAEAIATMTRQQLESARKTNAVQSAIANSAERATDASVKANSASERNSERMVSAAERSAAAAERAVIAVERSTRAVEESVQLQRQVLARSQR